jgi:hypothetical protein
MEPVVEIQKSEDFDSEPQIAGQILRRHVKYIAVKKGPANTGSATSNFLEEDLG